VGNVLVVDEDVLDLHLTGVLISTASTA